MDGHEARAKALEAREILVAVGLVDLPLASELCFKRLNGDAIRLLRAVAASLADRVIDEDAFGRVRVETPLAAAAYLGGAGLIIDKNGQAWRIAQFALNGVELVAMADVGSAWQAGIRPIFAGLLDHDHDAPGALPQDLMRDLRHAELAF